MRPLETISLLAMAALWGASFVFQRLLVPLFGPFPNTFLRLIIAGIALILFCLVTRHRLSFKGQWQILFVLGILSSALPYTLFAFGAQSLSAAILSVLNATAPMFGALFASLLLKEKLTKSQKTGLLIGTAGVAMVSKIWDSHLGDSAFLGFIACLLAAASYGLSSVLAGMRAKDIPPLTLATAGQLLGGLTLTPFALFLWPAAPLPASVWPKMVAFAILCSATPFLLYMWLLNRVGPTKALTVTFLIPVFGTLWGLLILREPLGTIQLIGGVVIVLGTAFVLRKEPEVQSPSGSRSST